MLFEKTIYENDFPINMRIMQVVEYPIHYHHDIEFVYVLKGEVRLKDVCSNYLLKEGDLFTINGHEVHGLTATDKDNVVAVIQISNRFFTQYFPSLGKACFMTGGKNDTHNKLDQLRKILLRILLIRRRCGGGARLGGGRGDSLRLQPGRPERGVPVRVRAGSAGGMPVRGARRERERAGAAARRLVLHEGSGPAGACHPRLQEILSPNSIFLFTNDTNGRKMSPNSKLSSDSI